MILPLFEVTSCDLITKEKGSKTHIATFLFIDYNKQEVGSLQKNFAGQGRNLKCQFGTSKEIQYAAK